MPTALAATIKGWTERIFPAPARINDSRYFEEAWSVHGAGATQELGTASDALKILRAVVREIGGKNCGREIANGFFWHYCRGQKSGLHDTIMLLQDRLQKCGDGIVGDPEDVHYIIPPRHCIGFARYTSRDGRAVCEVIEGLRAGLKVLHINGRIIAIQPYTILRQESNGHAKIL